jgi:HSP20 family protein
MSTTTAWDALAAMESLFDTLDRSAAPVWSTAGATPGIDVYADEDTVTVATALPGVKADDVRIELEDGVLGIAAERADDQPPAASRLLLREREAFRFARSIQLPFAVDAGRVQARLKDGILTVTLHRAEADKPRRIAVAAN